MTTHLDSFSEGVSQYLVKAVFPIIISHLTKKGLTVTVDELLAALNVPIPKGNHSTFEPETPAYLGGSSASTSATKSTTGGGTRRSTKDNYNGPTCRYIFTKGVKKGEYCGAPCAPDNPERCKSCARKKNGGGPGTDSGVTTSGGSIASETAAEENVLDAVSIDERKCLFRETKYNILIHQVGEITHAKGVIIDNNTLKTRPLNETEISYCKNKGMTISDQPSTAVSTTPSMAPSVTTSSNQPAATSGQTATSTMAPLSQLGNLDAVLKGLMQ